MAVNVQRYVNMHKRRRVKRTRMATAVGSMSLAALLTVSWGLKYIGFSLTNNQPFSLNTTVTRLDNPNPDTSVVGNNFYRQYLNVEGKEEVAPVDLLLLVDQSGSMAEKKDIVFGDSLEYRDVILSSFLNGKANADFRDNPDMDLDQYIIDSIANEDGFVNQFLGINSDNKVAIIGLNTAVDFTANDAMNGDYTFFEDAQVLLDWTNDPLTEKGVDVTGQNESGTDYAAGLMLANEMLNSDKVSNDGHKKVVIVIGDGEPTCYTDMEGKKVEFVAPEATITEITPAGSEIEEKIDELEDLIIPEETNESQINEEDEVDTEVIENNDVTETTESEITETEPQETEVTLESSEIIEETTVTEETTVETEETSETEITEETEVTLENSEVVEETTATEETTVETSEETDVTLETEVTEETIVTEETTVETEITEETYITEEIIETEPSEEVIDETEVTTEVTETTVEETTIVVEETATEEITESTEESAVEEAVAEQSIEVEPTEGMVEETVALTDEETDRMLFKGMKANTDSDVDVVETADSEEDTIEANEATTEETSDVEESSEIITEVVAEDEISAEAMAMYQAECMNATMDAFEALLENNKNLEVYSIGLSEDLKLTDLKENSEKFVITQLVSENGKYFYTGNNVEKLGKNIFNFLEKDMPKNVVVTAELSNYVKIAPMESSEIKVTMTDSEGLVNVVYDEANGGITEAGKYIVEDVVIVEPEEGATDTTGSVNLVFNPDYVLSKGNTFTMSYNVSLTSDAYETYAAGGYTDKGDKNTDFDSALKLSSGEKGFYINRDAYITYVVNGTRVGYNVEDDVNVFNRPVVQIDEEITSEEIEALVEEEEQIIVESESFPALNYTITSKGETPETKVVLNKNIDSLGDGENNPDTTLTGSEFYRLYLDIEGHDESKPVDLLIVVDQSGSMFDNKDVTYSGQTVYRDVAVSAILNGSASTARPGNPGSAETLANNKDTYWVQSSITDESLINEFLDLNEKNKVCVIGFDAWRSTTEGSIHYYDAAGQNRIPNNSGYNGDYYMYYHGSVTEKDSKGNDVYHQYRYQDDANVLTPWSDTQHGWISGQMQKPIDVTGKWNTGTNYAAGFRLARDMFTSNYVRNDGNEKVMIFISDGVPTCYIDSNNERQGSTTSTLGSDNQKPNADNINVCKNPSVAAFNSLITELHNQGIDVKAYSVGVSAELGNPDGHPYSSEVIRKCIANGGDYIYVDKDGDKLHNKLYDIINYTVPSQVIIRDKLSQYVEYYNQQPDVKVMMSKIGSNEAPVVLYQNGTVTNAGKNIIQTVTYTPVKGDDTTTGTIEAIFDPTYALEPGYKYSLSYNVKLTETSYNEFVGDGYNAKGDANSDYGTNTTSNNQDGFKSNKDAEVDFHFYGDEKTGTYDHPVVQVDKTNYFTDVTVVKNWEDDKGPIKPVEPVEVQLWQVGTPVSMSIYEDFNDLTFDENCIYKGIDQNNIQLVDVDSSGNKAVYITGREADWHGFDLKLTELRGKEVTIETNVKSSGGTVYGILYYNDGSDHYPRQFTIENCTNEYKTGSAKITVPANATTCRVYLSTSGKTDDLYIDYFNAVVPKVEIPAYVPPLADTNNQTTLNENFGNTSNYSDRGAASDLANADYPGNKAMMVTNRTQSWNGISIPIDKFAGKTITYEVRGMATNGSIQVGVQYTPSGSDTLYRGQFTIENSTNAYNSGTGTYSIPAGSTDCSVYIQGSEADADLFVDYVYISVEQYTPPHADMNVTTATYENFATLNTGTYNQRTGNNKLDTVLTAVGEDGNNALHISNRQNDWNGISFSADKFIGKQITVEVRGKASLGNISYGIQYDVSGKPTTYNNCSQAHQISSTSAYGVGSHTFEQIPSNATNCSVYIQGSDATSTLDLDYVYIYVPGQEPEEPNSDTRNPLMVMPDIPAEAIPTEGPYSNPVTLSYSENANKFTFQNLPKWGYDENGNKLMYSYYVIENTEGKTYESTTYSNDATPVTGGTITITNKVEGVFGFELPNTGGIGTGFNYLIGFILICIPGGFYIRRIRKGSVRDP